MATQPQQPSLPFAPSETRPRRLARPTPPGRASTDQVTIAGRTYHVVLARHRRARRYVLRMNDDHTLRLTVPRGASIAGGLRFVIGQGAWIDRERSRQQTRHEAWLEGTRFWYRGLQVSLTLAEGYAAWATERVRVDEDVRTAVEGRLRVLAERELPPRCRELARDCGLTVDGVVVRNQRSRWGACSPRRVITLNWRLVQMPADVSDYILFHELMHLNHPNHSARFWRAVAKVCPDWRTAERWLRRHGREIL